MYNLLTLIRTRVINRYWCESRPTGAFKNRLRTHSVNPTTTGYLLQDDAHDMQPRTFCTDPTLGVTRIPSSSFRIPSLLAFVYVCT